MQRWGMQLQVAKTPEEQLAVWNRRPDADQAGDPQHERGHSGDKEQVGNALRVAAEVMAEGEAMARCFEIAEGFLDGHAVAIDGDDPPGEMASRWQVADEQPGLAFAPGVLLARAVALAPAAGGETLTPGTTFAVHVSTCRIRR